MEIVDFGVTESADQIRKLARSCGQVVINNAVEFITNWWTLKNADGVLVAYFGTPETFKDWHKEQLQ